MSESQQLFDLVITGHSSTQPVEALVREILTLLNDHSAHLEFKLSDALLFSNGMVSIRDNISREEANAIRQQLAPLGVECDIRPTLQIVPKEVEEGSADAGIYTCPACGHQQPKRKEQNSVRLEACEVCGIVGERYHKKQRLQEVMQAESQKHDNERAKRIREVLERAKQEEEVRLQQEARRRLGLAEKPNPLGKVAAALAVVAVLGGSFGTVYYLNTPSAEEQQAAAEQAKEQTGAAGSSGEKGVAITIDAGNVPPEAVAAVMKAGEKLGGGKGGADAGGGSGAEAGSEPASAFKPDPKAESAEANAASATAAAPPAPSPEQARQQRETRQVKMTEALRHDFQQKQEQATEHKVQGLASAEAITSIEEMQLVKPRFGMLPEVHAENRRRIQQLLKLDEKDLTDTIIESVEEPYPRSLLMLDIAEWEIQHQKPERAHKAIDRIHRELAQTQDIAQQALITGAISKTHLLLDEWEQAGQSLQQSTETALLLPQLPEQIELLTRLANEQTLFGNQIAARQILEEATQLAQTPPSAGEPPRSDSFVQIASSYAMITDFAEANKLLPKVEDATKRQQLAEFIDKLQHRVEQVRVEYLQTAAGIPQP